MNFHNSKVCSMRNGPFQGGATKACDELCKGYWERSVELLNTILTIPLGSTTVPLAPHPTSQFLFPNQNASVCTSSKNIFHSAMSKTD
jgi:hypothetical protein